ncbi:TonB-dependent receptor [Iodidimonas nitroreducens]|uniref:TonB-dependent receptor n=1 Tax=Iodidimonas nitroreducens TaxID=1236968 RepID=A0A5A7NCA5_9PROT|nr:iron-regulated outer membrane virulence protein [alpha proteobacterium Q-1]GER05354.1 TonB-dependent receptor [Iodidimonas nitroreducens]
MFYAKSVLRATTALATSACLLGSASAWAQTQQQEPAELSLEEIVVTGSYIRRSSGVSQSSPISVIGSADIDKIGATNIANIIQTLTINTGSQNNPDAFTQNFSTGTSNINLRGLGVSSTLVLLNGRRQVVSGATTDDGVSFVDTSSLVPMIAIERMEILKDGAATLYGSDAVAGVVNFITRDRFEGFEIRADYQGVVDTGTQTDLKIEGMGGVQFDRGYAVAAISFMDRTSLTTGEKRLSEFGGPDVSSIGQPGTFILTAPPPNPLFGAIFNGLVGAGQTPAFADPGCASNPNSLPPAAVPAFGIPAGVVGFCRLDFGDFFNLVPEETRLQGFAKVGYSITDDLEFFTELSFARNRAKRGNTPTFPVLIPQTIPGFSGSFAPGTFGDPNNPRAIAPNPFNPFGVDAIALVRPLGQGEPVDSTHDSDTFRAAVGLDWAINDTWRLQTDLVAAQNDFTVSAQDTLGTEFFFALNGLGGENCNPLTGVPGVGNCQFFNPFASSFTAPEGATVINPVTGLPVPVANSDEIFDFILGRNLIDIDSDLLVVDAVLSGDLGDTITLPGGKIGLAIGAQFRNEEFSVDADTNSNNGNFLFVSGAGTRVNDWEADRDVAAVFAEINLPVTSWFEISSSVRYEDIDNVGDTVDPKVGVLITPTPDLRLRGTYSTSFRSPSLFQQNTEGFVALAQLTDPLVGNTAFIAEFTTGNQNLKPETSRQFNLGGTWEPSFLEGLSVDVDYWNFKFRDAIVKENAQALLDAAGETFRNTGNPLPLLAPQFVRPLGAALPLLSQVNTQFVNAPSIETDGVDLNLRYVMDTDYGVFSPFFEGTYIFNYDVFDPTLGIEIRGVGNRNFRNVGDPTPRLRFNSGINWAMGAHSFFAVGRYIHDYNDDQLSPTATFLGEENGRVSSQFTVDLQYSVQLGEYLDFAENVGVTVGAINVTGEDPPSVNTNGGFDSKIHDPRGRVLYVRLLTKF